MKYTISKFQDGVNTYVEVFTTEAETKEEAIENYKDYVWNNTDEEVWVNDGFAEGEKGFNDWFNGWNLDVEKSK